MHEVAPDELTGFRAPSMSEHQGILSYMEKRYRMELRPMNLWQAFCTALSGVSILSLAGSAGRQTLRESLPWLVLLFVAISAVWLIRNGKQGKKKLMSQLRTSAYEVLDCYAAEWFFSTKLNSQAEVKIRTMQGQLCSQKFLIDRDSGRMCRDNPDLPLLLMRCCGVYELFSRTKLRGE